MQFFLDIHTSSPGVPAWSFAALCALSFRTSAIAAAIGLGGGAALVAVMASLLPPTAIIAVHAVVQMGSNFSRAIMMRHDVLLTWMPGFVAGTFVGAMLGGQIVFALPNYILQGIIGVFVLYAVWGPKIRTISPSHIRFFGVGAIASFAIMFAGATGPLIAFFVNASTTHRRMTVATHAAFMSWQHGVKILVFGFLGFTFGPYIPLILLMIAFGIAGTWTGRFILNWMGEGVFRAEFNMILTGLALRLLYQAVTDLNK